MKAEKIIVNLIRQKESASQEEACDAALLYLLRKYCEGCGKLDSAGVSTGVDRRTGRERLFDGGSGK